MSDHSSHSKETSFEKVDSTLTKTIGIGVYRAVILLFIVAQLWLTSKFVSIEEFRRLQADVDEIKAVLRVMAAQDHTLADHESRIRALEQRR